MAKFIVGGAMVGVVVGTVLAFIFPNLMLLEIVLNNSSKSVDPFTTIGIPIPFILGVFGVIFGFIFYKMKYKE